MEIIKALRNCTADECHCGECPYEPKYVGSTGCISSLIGAAADALEAADKRVKELKAAQRWIPVGDRLPRSNKPVQVYMPKLYMSVQTGFYDRYYGEDDDEWYEHWVAPSEVTHWKPLPLAPKGE